MTTDQQHDQQLDQHASDVDPDEEFHIELADRGPNWPARILAGLTLLTLTFAAGAWAQQEWFADTAVPTGVPDFAALAGGGGLPELPEGLGAAIGGGGLPGAGAGGGAGGGSTAANLPAVVGTVVEVEGRTVIVEDLGGNRRTVTVSTETDITRTSDIDADQLEAGASITVRGDTTDDGTVEATEIAAN